MSTPTSDSNDEPREWLIRKRGYYYRPKRAGYTASVDEAGRYTESEAKAEAAIEPKIMSAVHQSTVGGAPPVVRTSNEQAFRALLLEWARACPNPPEWHWSFDLHIRTVNTLGERPSSETCDRPTPHHVRWDFLGWLCSVCGGWNDGTSRSCRWPHEHAQKADDVRDTYNKHAAEKGWPPTESEGEV